MSGKEVKKKEVKSGDVKKKQKQDDGRKPKRIGVTRRRVDRVLNLNKGIEKRRTKKVAEKKDGKTEVKKKKSPRWKAVKGVRTALKPLISGVAPSEKLTAQEEETRKKKIAARNAKKKEKKQHLKPVNEKFDIEVPLPKKKQKHELHPHKALRSSLKPGTILITLKGRHLGRRVIFLKRLESGALLCAGPKQINKAPLHRLNPRFVIATSTQIDISSVKLDHLKESEIFTRYIKKKKKATKKEKEATFFKKPRIPKKRGHRNLSKEVILGATKAIDKQILPLVEKVPFLRKYLRARFSLRRGQFPHELNF